MNIKKIDLFLKRHQYHSFPVKPMYKDSNKFKLEVVSVFF